MHIDVIEMLPKTQQALERDYANCKTRRKFITIDKEAYTDYLNEAHSDLASAQKEFESGSLKWALVKIYQSLFLLCNAILAKNLGFYSKDHKCLITALMKANLISKDALEQLKGVVSKRNLFEEITNARLERNQAMYFPKSRRRLTDTEIRATFAEIKTIIQLLGEQI